DNAVWLIFRSLAILLMLLAQTSLSSQSIRRQIAGTSGGSSRPWRFRPIVSFLLTLHRFRSEIKPISRDLLSRFLHYRARIHHNRWNIQRPLCTSASGRARANHEEVRVTRLLWLSVREVAGRLGVAATTVYALCQRKRIEHIRVGAAKGAIRISEE